MMVPAAKDIVRPARQGPRKAVAMTLALCLPCALTPVSLLHAQTAADLQELQRMQDSPQALPGAVEPGRDRPEPAEIPSLGFEISLQIPGGQQPPADMADAETELNGIEIKGVNVYRLSELAHLYEDMIGTTVTYGEIYGIANAIEAKYRKDGYSLTFAFIPPQDVAEGVFTIEVNESYIDEVVVEGGTDRLKAKLENSLQPLTLVRPLHISDLERFLLLSNDFPGVKAQGILQPSKLTSGASRLVVKVQYERHQVFAELSNRASEYAGPWSVSSGFRINSPFGMGEVISGTANATLDDGEVLSAGLGYVQPLNDQGTSVGANFTYALLRPGRELKRWQTVSEGTEFRIFASHPFIRQRELNLSLKGGLEFSHGRTDLDFFRTRLTDERISALFMEATLGRRGARSGSSQVTFSVRQGLPALGSYESGDDLLSRPDAEGWFQTFGIKGTHHQPLLPRTLPGLGLLASVQAQYAPTALPASEEVSFGGSFIGRGYDSSTVIGENGIGAALELRYDFAVNSEYLDQLQFYGFYDMASAWDYSAGLAETQTTLASGGTGLRMLSNKGYRAELEYAAPLTRVPDTAGVQRERDHRVFFRIYGTY